MATFILIGSQFINSDHINRVEIVEDAHGKPVQCRVWFVGGANCLLTDADAAKLIAFLKARKLDT